MKTATVLQAKFRGCPPTFSRWSPQAIEAMNVPLEYAEAFEFNRAFAQGADAGYRYAEFEIAGQKFCFKRCDPDRNVWLPADMVDTLDKVSLECLKDVKSVLFKTRFTHSEVQVAVSAPGTIEAVYNGFFLVRDLQHNYLWEARPSELTAA